MKHTFQRHHYTQPSRTAVTSHTTLAHKSVWKNPMTDRLIVPSITKGCTGVMGCYCDNNLLELCYSQDISAGYLSHGICIDSLEINRYLGKVCWGEGVPGPMEIMWCFGFADTGISRYNSTYNLLCVQSFQVSRHEKLDMHLYLSPVDINNYLVHLRIRQLLQDVDLYRSYNSCISGSALLQLNLIIK